MSEQENSLDSEMHPLGRRRDLLPRWIRVCVWIFLVLGLLAPIALLLGLFGFHFDLALYGLETNEPLSSLGLLLIFLFGFKGIVAFGLWKERTWAVSLAMLDAILGIVLCAIVMLYPEVFERVVAPSFNFRLELLLLIPYLLKMNAIRRTWPIHKVLS